MLGAQAARAEKQRVRGGLDTTAATQEGRRIREVALDYALRNAASTAAAGGMMTPDDVLAAAGAFESFITGGNDG